VVIVILFVLLIYSFGVMIDRWLVYSVARKKSRVVRDVAGALKQGKLDEAIAIAERNKKTDLAKDVVTGLSELLSASPQTGPAVVAAKRDLERSVSIVHAGMNRRLSALATIGFHCTICRSIRHSRGHSERV
jgi:biopolymer transport protein ExbB